MTSSRSYDFVIAGKGVLGLSTAYRLMDAQPDARIAVVGPAIPIGAASRAAGAMLGCFGEVTEAGLACEEGRAKLRLDRAAAEAWPGWLDRINERKAGSPISISRGTFVILNTRSGKLDDINYSAILRALREHDEPFQLVDPAQVPGLVPVDDSRPAKAIYVDGEGSVAAELVLDAMLARLSVSPRVTLIDGSVVSPLVEAGRVRGIALETGEQISTRHFIVAAGCASQGIFDQVYGPESPIPMILAGAGCSLVIDQPADPIRHVVRTPNRSFACGLHVVPRPAGLLYVGATNNIYLAPETQPTLSDILFLLECTLDQINHTLQGRHITAIQTGNRPVPIDTYPLVGRTSIEGLHSLTGTYRDGFHLSPLLSEYIVQEILGQSTHVDLKMFQPERRILQPMTKEAAIRQASLYYSAVGFEHGIKIPRVGWEEMLSEMIEQKVRSLYDELDSDFVLHPDLVSLVDQDRPRMIPFFRGYFRRAGVRR